MLMKSRLQSAFTLIAMLVVISIIAVLAAFAVPALTSALTKGQMTGTLNNGRQLYLAAQQMALDGAANADPSLSWPGDYTTAPKVSEYMTTLVNNDYLKPGDVQKLMNGPSPKCVITYRAASHSTRVKEKLLGRSASKFYLVRINDSSNVIFIKT